MPVRWTNSKVGSVQVGKPFVGVDPATGFWLACWQGASAQAGTLGVEAGASVSAGVQRESAGQEAAPTPLGGCALCVRF